MEIIDCRGLACPGPVIQVKKKMEGKPPGSIFAIEVDSEASRENVRRFAKSRGAAVSVEEIKGDAFRLTVTTDNVPSTQKEQLSPVVFVTSDVLGSGDDKLGGILMEGFVNTLSDQDTVPDKIIFMNTGVRLAVEGSPVLDTLTVLSDRGCEIMSCGTCLEYFSLKDNLAVGIVSNMYDIQRSLMNAAKVIRP